MNTTEPPTATQDAAPAQTPHSLLPTLDPDLNETHENPRPAGQAMQPDETLGSDTLEVIASCRRRAAAWRVPPNWSKTDWGEEVRGILLVAAWTGQDEFDPQRGVPFAGFLHQRAMSRVLTRYRQEWSYGLRFRSPCSSALLDEGEDEAEPLETGGRESGEFSFPGSDGPSEECDLIADAVAALPEPSRRLIQRLFFEEKPEREVAAELGISQPAVSQRKHAILRRLRSAIDAARAAEASGRS